MFTQASFLYIILLLKPVSSDKLATGTALEMNSLIPSRDYLKQCLEEHYHMATQTLIQEFKYKQKTKALTYLPTIGYNFISFLPSITYNTSKLVNSIHQQRTRKSKIRSIQAHMNLMLQNELEKLNRYYADLEAEINYYNHITEAYLLSKTLLHLKTDQYNNLEITPLEFLKSQTKLKKEELKVRQKYTDILKLRNYILEIAKATTNERSTQLAG